MVFAPSFLAASKQVKKYARKSSEEIKAAVENIKANLEKQPRIAPYVGDFLPAQVEKVYVEMGGKPFVAKKAEADDHEHHAQAHGRELLKAK